MSCSCGGWIVVSDYGTNPVTKAVYEHSLTAPHRAWRWWRDQGSAGERSETSGNLTHPHIQHSPGRRL